MGSKARRTFLDTELADEITRRAKAQGRSESSLIADAVRLLLSAGSELPKRAEAMTEKRQLNRIETRLDTLFRDQAMMREVLLVFVRIWLEHNPPLDEESADSAALSAEGRFSGFLNLVAQEYARSNRKGNGTSPQAGIMADAADGTSR